MATISTASSDKIIFSFWLLKLIPLYMVTFVHKENADRDRLT